MTETTAFASVQPHGRPKLETIGKPLPGVQGKIAEDGEIKLKGVNMVKHLLVLSTAFVAGGAILGSSSRATCDHRWCRDGGVIPETGSKASGSPVNRRFMISL